MVVDDWPDIALVAPAELDVIETYLGRLLDEILTPSGKLDHPRASPEICPGSAATPPKRTSP